jgi:uncharacterized cupredoxin-like copper-binding protein
MINRYVVAAVITVLSSGAWAHGSHVHDTSAQADYAKATETAFGRAADPGKAIRTITVEMTDQMRFTPSQITVKRGEIVRFVPVNNGKVMHEMVLGTSAELQQHAEMMKKHPGMKHDAPNMAHVAPGANGQIGWQFSNAGEFFYGCLVPGHFDAGMVGRIVVVQ